MANQAEKFAQAAKRQDDKPSRGWKYYVRRSVIYLVSAYVILCVAVYFLQKKFVYRPVHETALAPQDYGFAPQQAQALETRTADGLTLHGWVVFGKGKKGVVATNVADALLVDLFFCGNGGNRGDRGEIFKRLTSLGATIVCFDYRGYGDSEGNPDEDGLAADARAAWDFLQKQNVPKEAIVIHGESLGGAVAIRLAAELCKQNTPPAGLITEATFTRLRDVASRHYPFLPVTLLLNQNFPSIEQVAAVDCPILMLHGKCDEVVPFALGRELFDAAPPASKSGFAKEFVELPTCRHNNMGQEDAPQYIAALRGFYVRFSSALIVKTEHTPKPRQRPARPTPPPSPRPEK